MSDDSNPLQKVFEKFGGGQDGGKISADNAKKWLKQAGITGENGQVSEEDAESQLPSSAKDEDGGGMDMSEFKQYVQKLGKDNGSDGNDMMSKLQNAVPSTEDAKQKVQDIFKSKIGGI